MCVYILADLTIFYDYNNLNTKIIKVLLRFEEPSNNLHINFDM